MKSNCDGNILSYICTAFLLVLLFALPICIFLASGFAIDVQGYSIKDVSDPIPVFSGMNISSDVLSTMDIAENDIVVVAPSFYDTAMQSVTGFIPYLMGLIIILTPLSELIQYFIMRRKGEELELVAERSIMPMCVLMLVSAIGAVLVQVTGFAATYAQGLTTEVISENTSAILSYSVLMFVAMVIAIILWVIPIICKIFTQHKNKDLLEEDESEFIDMKAE